MQIRTLTPSHQSGDSASFSGRAVPLPPRLRILYVAGHRKIGAWLFEALDRELPAKVSRQEVIGPVAGLARLQEEDFDLVLLSHEPPELDALQLTQAARTAGSDLPIVILGNQSEQELAASSYEHGADAYLCAHTATLRTVLWVAARAIERFHLLRENRRLHQMDEQRSQRDQEEVAKLLEEHRRIVGQLRARWGRQSSPVGMEPSSLLSESMQASLPCDALARHGRPLQTIPLLPSNFAHHYRDVLRAYVIMGCGTLAKELTELVDVLASTGISALSVLELHTEVVSDLVRGLGSRSARHVLNRAYLLIVELLLRLADSYRERYWEREHPPTQLFLPGFEPRLGRAA
ncbi:MAG: hypothetical protein NZ899_03955 [Thermoguttaceae bacterium]|nr:hypothetical protein [Thermoguttaceae bacterium]MDW8077712.1 hypothetical protein [Thermoguttaceae bacterium]